jgi:hypothetical protein
MLEEEIIKEKEIILNQYKKYAPEVFKLFGLNMKVREYSDSLYQFKTQKEHLKRQDLIKQVIRKKIKNIFGENVEKELKVNLSQGLSFNIADHHQVLNNPLLLSSNIISSVSKIGCATKQDAIIVISSGDVPPNNYFSKNGFLFHNKRIPLFSNRETELCSYYVPKRDFNFIDKLKIADRWKDFNPQEKNFLLSEYKKISNYDYSKCNNYIDQITVIVKEMWPFLFEASLRKELPELLYLTQEEIVTECLIKILEQDNIISKILFDDDLRSAVINNFRGIVVTWNEKEEKGTHFFWRKYPNRSQSLRLYLEKEYLTPTDSRFKNLKIKLSREEIIELLRKKEIYPSLFLIFMVLNFYSGVKPLVGYGSVTYLYLMKQAWGRTLNSLGYKEEEGLLNNIETNGLVAGIPIYFKRVEEKLKTLYAYDIIYEGGMKQEYLEKVFDMPIKDFFLTAISEMYDYYGPKYIPRAERIKSKINFDIMAELIFKWV